MSLGKWSGISPLNTVQFIGLGNYFKLLSDDIFLISLRNTFLLGAGILILINVFSLAFAIALTYYVGRRVSNILRVILFVPMIFASVIVGFVWRRILGSLGLLNQVLASVGLGDLQRAWLGDPSTSLIMTIVVVTWQWTSMNMMYYMAGIQGVPLDMIDASLVDGAGDWQRIRHVIIPMLTRTITLNVILNLIGAFRMFDQVYILTRGGPIHSSEVLGTYMFWLAFDLIGPSEMGYASAIAVILALSVFALSYARMRTEKAERIEY